MADSDIRPRIALLSADLHFPASHSLKTKRRILKGLKDRLRARFNLAVAEVGYQDKWQRSVVCVCTLGNEQAPLDAALQDALRVMESTAEIQILGHQAEFI